MGCDIHLYTERKFNNKWWCTDHFKLNKYYNKEDEFESKWECVHIYDDRNYAAFGALADVRNYYNNDVIDMPRGLPIDVSKRIKKEADSWGMDGHSHSWFTARELFDYQKLHNEIHYQGMLNPEDVKKLDEEGITPTSWCQWTNISGAEYRKWTEKGCVLDGLIERVKDRMAEEFSIYDFCSDEEKEEKYNKYADDFRIVFWFDN